jgi:hypothetical protein
MTQSGKTTLAKKLAQNIRNRGLGVLVLDPIATEWPANAVFRDFAEFMETARASRRCFLFVDEAGMNCGQNEKDAYWLATIARHWGHSTIFISQRAIQIAKTMRDQCSYLYLFNCSASDAKTLSDEWNKPELQGAAALAQGEYFYAPRFGEVQKRRVF